MTTHIGRRGVIGGVLVVVAMTILHASAQTTYTWATGSGTWDDSTTANWSPPGIPGNTDTANLTIPTNQDILIEFTSAEFTDGDALENMTVRNTGGGTTTFRIDSGDLLSYNGDLHIEDGVILDITGGMITNPPGHDWGNNFFLKNARMTISGGINTVNTHAYLGGDAGGTWSEVVITNGVFQRWSTSSGGGDFNAGRGSNTVLVAGDGQLGPFRGIYVGKYIFGSGNGTHRFTVTDNAYVEGYNYVRVGLDAAGGDALFVQSNGTVRAGLLNVYSNGVYRIETGSFRSDNVQLRGGLLDVRGGTVNNTYELQVGSASGDVARVNMSGGTFSNRYILVGAESSGGSPVNGGRGIVHQTGGRMITRSGTIQVGHTANPSQLSEYIWEGGDLGRPSSWIYLIVDPGSTFRGRGTLLPGTPTTGTLRPNGIIIADGFGVETNLNFSNLRDFEPEFTNSANNGFYAQNGGQLLLPKVNVNAATTNGYNWAESQDDFGIDLVNSARLEFTGLSGSGSLTGALFAVDRPEADAFGQPEISVHEFGLIGSATFTSCDLTIRYDPSVAPAHEDNMVLLQWDGTTWNRLSTTLDKVNKRITAANLTALGRFTLAVYPRGTVVRVE